MGELVSLRDLLLRGITNRGTRMSESARQSGSIESSQFRNRSLALNLLYSRIGVVAGLLLAVVVLGIVNRLSHLSFESYVGTAKYVQPHAETVVEPLVAPKDGWIQPAPTMERSIPIASDLRSGLAERGIDGYHGPLVDLLTAAIQDSEINGQIVGLSTVLSLSEMRRGRPMLALVFGGHRTGLLHDDEPLLSLPQLLFSHADRPLHYRGVESLQTLRLGIVDGDRMEAELDGYIEEHRGNGERLFVAKGERAFERLLDMLLLGRIDLLVASPSMIKASSRSLGVDPETFALVKGGHLGEWDLYLVCDEYATPEVREALQSISRWARSETGRDQVNRIKSRIQNTEESGPLK